jgi:hypothetical protein
VGAEVFQFVFQNRDAVAYGLCTLRIRDLQLVVTDSAVLNVLSGYAASRYARVGF